MGRLKRKSAFVNAQKRADSDPLAHAQSTVEPRYLKLAYFELSLISKWKSGPCFNKKLWQQVTK